MLENGKIEWKNYQKTPPVYVGPDSCHDPAVMSSIVKVIGQRLRTNSSKTEYLEESVENTAKALKITTFKIRKSHC